jgi:hypothetical protein
MIGTVEIFFKGERIAAHLRNSGNHEQTMPRTNWYEDRGDPYCGGSEDRHGRERLCNSLFSRKIADWMGSAWPASIISSSLFRSLTKMPSRIPPAPFAQGMTASTEGFHSMDEDRDIPAPTLLLKRGADRSDPNVAYVERADDDEAQIVLAIF